MNAPAPFDGLSDDLIESQTASNLRIGEFSPTRRRLGFVDKHSGIEGLTRRLVRQLLAHEPAQLAVDKWQ